MASHMGTVPNMPRFGLPPPIPDHPNRLTATIPRNFTPARLLNLLTPVGRYKIGPHRAPPAPLPPWPKERPLPVKLDKLPQLPWGSPFELQGSTTTQEIDRWLGLAPPKKKSEQELLDFLKKREEAVMNREPRCKVCELYLLTTGKRVCLVVPCMHTQVHLRCLKAWTKIAGNQCPVCFRGVERVGYNFGVTHEETNVYELEISE